MATIISADILQNKQDPLKLPVVNQDTTDYGSIIQSQLGNVQNLSNQVSEFEKGLGNEQNAILNLQSQLGGIGDTQAQLESQANIAQQKKDVLEASNALNSLAVQQRQIPLQGELDAVGRGRLTSAQGRLDDKQIRDNAIRALSIGADLQAKQGNLALAQENIKNAIDLKFKSLENQLNIRKQAYEMNKENLERLDKKRADALAYSIKKEEQRLQDQKENELAIDNMIVQAAPNAPADVISRARSIKEKGGSRLAVAQALGVYGGDYLKTQLLKAQIDTERAQRAKIGADIEKIRSEMTSKGLPATTANLAKVEASQSVYDLAQELKTAEGKGGAVGFGIKKSIIGSLPFVEGDAIAGTDRATYEAKFKQLKDTLASANLDKLKGAMSDKDIEFLRNIGTALSLDMPETAFDAELDKVSNVMSKIPGVQVKLAPQNNKFNQALGVGSQSIPGTSIVNSVDDNGNINFIIP